MENTDVVVRKFVVEELLHGQDASELTNTTPLMSTSILDSIAIIKLAVFLEEKFDIVVEPHEIGPDEMDTIDMIVKFVQTRS